MIVVRLYHLSLQLIYAMLLPLAFVLACAAGTYGCLKSLGALAHERGYHDWSMTSESPAPRRLRLKAKTPFTAPLNARQVEEITVIDSCHSAEPRARAEALVAPSGAPPRLKSLPAQVRARLSAIRSSLWKL